MTLQPSRLFRSINSEKWWNAKLYMDDEKLDRTIVHCHTKYKLGHWDTEVEEVTLFALFRQEDQLLGVTTRVPSGLKLTNEGYLDYIMEHRDQWDNEQLFPV